MLAGLGTGSSALMAGAAGRILEKECCVSGGGGDVAEWLGVLDHVCRCDATAVEGMELSGSGRWGK
jgi:hypothetical protein